MAAGVSKDTSESDPEQEDGHKEVLQLRLKQDISEWLVNVMSL